MKIAFVGNQDNNAYRLCKWVRQAGHEASLYMFRQERGPRSRPELVDPSLGDGGTNYPDWIHWYDDTRGRLSLLLPSKLAKEIERNVDVVVTSGATGLLAAKHFRQVPVVHYSLGSEIAEFPLRLLKFNVSPAWWVVAGMARRSIRHVRKVLEVYSRSILAMKKLGQLDKLTLCGFGEDLQGNRARVDQQLLAELNARYAKYDCVFLWLTRLNMGDPNSIGYKAPERFLEAFEKIALHNRFNVRAIIGNHGSHAGQFRQMATAKGLDPYIDYVEHLPYYQLLTHASIGNVVVVDVPDEEKGGTLGGTAREALSVGALVIEGLDDSLMRLVFGPDCPIPNGKTAQACYDAMHKLLKMTPAQRQELQNTFANWVEKNLNWPSRVEPFLRILEETIYFASISEKSRRWANQDPTAMKQVTPRD